MSACLVFSRLLWIAFCIYTAGVHAESSQGSPANDKPLVITTILEKPYLFRCGDHSLLSSCIPVNETEDSTPNSYSYKNTQVQGFLVDLLKALAEKGNFRYELHLIYDNQYGIKDEVGGWTGMIGELIKEKADLALASFPVTKERTEVVDFTPPLFDHGLAILYKKPQVDAEGKLLIPFANVYELSRQTAIQYGIVAGGSTSHFFKNSQAEPFKRMWAFMEAHPEQSFVNDYEKGIERVQNYNGTFAFIMEKLAAEYVMGRACDTMVIGFGERWNSTVKGSSLALPLSSPWKLTLSRLIEELKADGSIAALYEKWWKGTC